MSTQTTVVDTIINSLRSMLQPGLSVIDKVMIYDKNHKEMIYHLGELVEHLTRAYSKADSLLNYISSTPKEALDPDVWNDFLETAPEDLNEALSELDILHNEGFMNKEFYEKSKKVIEEFKAAVDRLVDAKNAKISIKGNTRPSSVEEYKDSVIEYTRRLSPYARATRDLVDILVTAYKIDPPPKRLLGRELLIILLVSAPLIIKKLRG